MALTVRSVLELDNLRGFRLVAGEGGLDRPVVRTGIVDFEFSPDVSLNRPVIFDKDSFVISSLLFAKGDESALYDAVEKLIEMGVSALAYKNVFFHHMPKEVINLANKSDFAIFVFDDSAYFEDIIADLSLAIRKDSQLTVMELKLREIVKQNHSRDAIHEISRRLFPEFKDKLVAFYCLYKSKQEQIDVERIMRNYTLNNIKQTEIVIAKYGAAMIILISYNAVGLKRFVDCFQNIMVVCGLTRGDFICGYSTIKNSREELDYALREAIYAQQAARLLETDFICFSQIGMYQFLLPYEDSIYMQQFMQQYLAPLLMDESEQNNELLKTAVAYVRTGGNLKESANRLFIHENTVRYRMNKLRIKLDAHNDEYVFFANLSCAIWLYLVKETWSK